MNEEPHPVDNCPFCKPVPRGLVAETELTRTIRDTKPVSPGHTLVVPRRHFASYFEATPEELTAIQEALFTAREAAMAEFGPDAFNIGVNDGWAAGQTVMHLHVHLIPRFMGDRDDPRGGVRWMIPEKAQYWEDKEA